MFSFHGYSPILVGKCTECGCDWSRHQHITYEYHRQKISVPLTLASTDLFEQEKLSSPRPSSTRSSSPDSEHLDLVRAAAVNQRIRRLKDEQSKMFAEYTKLCQFLHKHALVPYNDDILEYLKIFISQEKKKHRISNDRTSVIEGLEAAMKAYEEEMEFFKNAIQSSAAATTDSSAQQNAVPTLTDIRSMVEELYQLPINGQKIRDQVEGVKQRQVTHVQDHEKVIALPLSTDQSDVLAALNDLFQ